MYVKGNISSLKGNVLANLAGRFWSAGLSVLAVPVFLHILGAEAFGLVGLFASLQVVFAFLDLGLSVTVNREIAQNDAKGKTGSENKILVRTFEIIYWSIAIIIGVVLLIASDWFATNWVNVRNLARTEVWLAIAIMSFSIAVRWPVALYAGVLQGLQKQVLQNGIFIAGISLRTLGALAVIAWISPTITAFLLTQAAANTLEVAAIWLLTWRELDRQSSTVAFFQADVLRRVWRFALSFNAVGVLGMILSQSDRLVISKYLPLEQLGYYAIASTAVGAMPLISNAVVTAVYPLFSAQAALGDKDALALYYHRAVQAIAFPTVGVALAVAFFPYDILALWTQSLQVARQCSEVLSLLAVASLFMALHNPGYMLLVAHGYIRIPLIVNGINVAIFIPALLILVPMRGIEVAAFIWLAQNMMVLFVYSYFVGKFILKKSTRSFLMQDIFPYVLFGCLWIGSARLLTLSNGSPLLSYMSLASAAAGYCLSIIFFSRKALIFPSGLLIWSTPGKSRT